MNVVRVFGSNKHNFKSCLGECFECSFNFVFKEGLEGFEFLVIFTSCLEKA